MSTGQPLVVLDHVDKWFGDLHVLQDINISIDRGEVVVAARGHRGHHVLRLPAVAVGRHHHAAGDGGGRGGAPLGAADVQARVDAGGRAGARDDRAVLDVLCRRFGGGPVGVSTLAVAVG